MYKLYKSIFLQHVQNNLIPDVVSYGDKKGCFLTNLYTLTKYAIPSTVLYLLKLIFIL